MISLVDSIEIQTTPGELFDWLDRLPQAYTSWHRDHVAYRVLRGSMLEVGSEVECEEYLHGKLHSMRLRTTKVVPEKRVEYAIRGMGRGAFEAQEEGDTTRFVAELEIGTDIPVIGRIFDLIFSRFFSQRIECMKQHMAEEGQNLKSILESGSPGINKDTA
ncbi:MAG: hypothetical protein JSU77_07925 [Fidelibacterota bacterium]|nr:MAG: hypothetical protein JSU77_07925 [Candidatus Neomarinimicrobiota bacterium]